MTCSTARSNLWLLLSFLVMTEQLGHYAGKNYDVGTNHLQSFPNAEFTDLKPGGRRLNLFNILYCPDSFAVICALWGHAFCFSNQTGFYYFLHMHLSSLSSCIPSPCAKWRKMLRCEIGSHLERCILIALISWPIFNGISKSMFCGCGRLLVW